MRSRHRRRLLAQLDVGRGDHDVQQLEHRVGQVERAVLEDVDLDSLQQRQALHLRLHLGHLPRLGQQPLGAQSVDDLDARRVVGDAKVAVAAGPGRPGPSRAWWRARRSIACASAGRPGSRPGRGSTRRPGPAGPSPRAAGPGSGSGRSRPARSGPWRCPRRRRRATSARRRDGEPARSGRSRAIDQAASAKARARNFSSGFCRRRYAISDRTCAAASESTSATSQLCEYRGMAKPKVQPADRIPALVEALLGELGEDPDRQGLKATPGRVSRALRELTDGYDVAPEDVIAGRGLRPGLRRDGAGEGHPVLQPVRAPPASVLRHRSRRLPAEGQGGRPEQDSASGRCVSRTACSCRSG